MAVGGSPLRPPREVSQDVSRSQVFTGTGEQSLLGDQDFLIFRCRALVGDTEARCAGCVRGVCVSA